MMGRYKSPREIPLRLPSAGADIPHVRLTMRYAQVRLFINSSLRTNDTLFGCTPGMAALTLQRAFQMGDAVTWRHQQQRRTKEVVNHALMYIKNTAISRPFCYSITCNSFVFVYSLAMHVNRSESFSRIPEKKVSETRTPYAVPTTIFEGSMLKMRLAFALGWGVMKGRWGKIRTVRSLVGVAGPMKSRDYVYLSPTSGSSE